MKTSFLGLFDVKEVSEDMRFVDPSIILRSEGVVCGGRYYIFWYETPIFAEVSRRFILTINPGTGESDSL